MTTTEDRRVDGIQRVPVEALVEVCGVGGKVTPFEAESADVSGRGIRLRTAYLPEQGAPVVCRFESAGREVLAEGVVAWCQKETRGGEFGVRFTALDARSAETLRELCGIAADGSVPPPAVEGPPPDAARRVIPGAKVKLHIDGLGSPMRARVDEGKGKHISVGSSLEFLRIGRKLEMESIEDGTRREARIDGLDVMIDPSTGVPRLLVLLKTDGDEDTPQPSVVDAARRTARGKASGKPAIQDREASQKATPKASAERPAMDARAEGPSSAEADDPTDEQVDAMVGRVRQIAGATRRKVNEVTIQIGARLGPSMGRAFDRVKRLSRRPTEPERRRTTAAPTANTASADRKLRPQNRASQPDAEPATKPTLLQSPRMRRAAGSVVAAGLIGTVLLVALRNPDAAKADTASQSTPGNAVAVGSPAANGVAASPITPGSPVVGGPGGAISMPATPGQPQSTGLIAPVPLFGPTSMATLESAAVGDPTGESAAVVAAREQALAKATQAALASGVDASKLSEEPGAETASSEEPATKPEDVAPFGHGRMKDPILYRLKLDSPGEALKGTSSSKGFTVTIPGRKLLESPKGFVKRDERFAKISAANGSDGVKITWQFKAEAPPFRVRLRKSAVEILISEAAKAAK